jgi:hypothetical protein
MLAMLAIGFHVPTMPTICGGIFAGGFLRGAILLGTLALLAELSLPTGSLGLYNI